ncbi:hypothetical protein DSO57_1023512 [Entomophthora muscae]|uniref:Uncharacterized protein n=1 Tax=Entomophthora muscae TaxID=34485 RepID=A0ACC2TE93_9FUNG|nr:hypothetical protein DSO57_1023512 [Entomophthora muscae]
MHFYPCLCCVWLLGTTVKFRGPPLALDWDVFPRPSKKVARVQAKPLQNLEDLAHTVDKHFVLAFPAKVLISPLESPGLKQLGSGALQWRRQRKALGEMHTLSPQKAPSQ